ncbi:MAG TPA: FixH family protein [Pseudolabrys sp.]|jgi:nitrogen fixation protein FixH|nr:FixH family protein [Pseudolabrys sp.]
MRTPRKKRELTGKHVLFCLLGFFGVVFAVNGVLVKAATSTFGGVETSSSYQAGLMFEQDVARAEQQDALHWQIGGKLSRDNAGAAVLDISARDAKGALLAGLTARARLAHPANERLDRIFALNGTGTGQFHGEVQAQAGQWGLIVDLYRGDARVFRSHSRVTLR